MSKGEICGAFGFARLSLTLAYTRVTAMSAFVTGGGAAAAATSGASNEADRDDEAEDPKQYLAFMVEAKQKESELNSLQERTGCVRLGRSKDGLPIILLIPQLGLPRVLLPGETEKSILHNVMLLFFKVAHEVVKSPFDLVYGHAPLSFTSQREVFVKSYSMLPHRYKKNIKDVTLKQCQNIVDNLLLSLVYLLVATWNGRQILFI